MIFLLLLLIIFFIIGFGMGILVCLDHYERHVIPEDVYFTKDERKELNECGYLRGSSKNKKRYSIK